MFSTFVNLRTEKNNFSKLLLKLTTLLDTGVCLHYRDDKNVEQVLIANQGMGLGYLLPLYCLFVDSVLDNMAAHYSNKPFFYVDDINIVLNQKEFDVVNRKYDVDDYIYQKFEQAGLVLKREKIFIAGIDEPGIFCEKFYGSKEKKVY